MNSSPFEFPPRPLDRCLRWTAYAERLLRAGFRWIAHPRRLRWREVKSLFLASRRGGHGGRAPSAPVQPAILYLPALGWDQRFQRPQHLAVALARTGRPVLYVDGFLRTWAQPRCLLEAPSRGVHRLRLRIRGRPDPFRDALDPSTVEELAAVLEGGIATPVGLILAQLPFWAPLALALRDHLGVPLVYDRIDLHAELPGVPATVAGPEEELISRADLVTATSGDLAARSRGTGRRVCHLANAVKIEDFREVSRQIGGRPRAGFAGALNLRIDDGVLRRVARDMECWELALAGLVEAPEIRALAGEPRVHLLGEVSYDRIPAFLASLDVGLIPYRDLPLTRAIDPVKLYEMFATGLPVVARRLPELERWAEPLLYLYDLPEEVPDLIRRARGEDTAVLREERRVVAQANTWDDRARRLLEAVAASR